MKRILTIFLAAVMLTSCVTLPAFAAEFEQEQPLGMKPIGAEGYVTMTSSQELIDIIKVMEGFSATPYYDNSQYSVGYGCNANQPEGYISSITPEEAEVLLKRVMEKDYEKSVNNYCRKIGRQPSQNQFDALVSFTYNLGSSWMSSSRLNTWLRNPTTEMEFVNAMGQWCRAGGELMFTLAQRRVREAIMFLKGEYSLPTKPNENHNVKTNIPVISPGALPYYTSVIYQYGYDTDSVKTGKGNAVAYFPTGSNYDNLLIPTREGYRFTGWKITRINGNKTTIGGMVDAMTVVETNLELTALWTEVLIEDTVDPENPDASVPTDPTEPEDPTEPTEPEDPTETTDPEEETTPDKEEDEIPEEEEPEEENPEVEEPEEEIPVDDFVFRDVKETAWYREAVEFVYDNGLMNGVSENSFDPAGNMSRGMLVTVLWRMDGSPEVTDEQREAFDDIAGKYYTDAVAWAKENGIVNGIDDRTFAPDNRVTRQDAVAILYRFSVTYCGKTTDLTAELDDFLDAVEVAQYAVEPMQWAVAVGLINGTTTTDGLCLNPMHNLTRCENAAILMRCVNEILSA